MNNSALKTVKSIVTSREFILAALLVIASVIVSFFVPVFLSKTTILAMVIAITVNGVIAIGMVMLLACGEMDFFSSMPRFRVPPSSSSKTARSLRATASAWTSWMCRRAAIMGSW